MGAALPSAGLGVASLRERHGESLLWTGQSTGQVLQDGEAGVGSSAGARTFDHVAVAAACRAEATTIRAAERLHRQREGRLGLDQLRQVETETRLEEHTSELQSQFHLVCRLLLEKKKLVLTVTIIERQTS